MQAPELSLSNRTRFNSPSGSRGQCRFLARLGVILALLLVSNFSSLAAEKPVRALIVTGGCCHDYDTQQHLVSKGISALTKVPIEWTIVNYKGKGQRIPLYGEKDWAKPYDIVFHNECFAHETDPEWVEKIVKPHREGVAAIVMHCTMHSYGFGKVDNWVKFLGVSSPNHGAHYAYNVEPLVKDHPIVEPLGDGWMTPKGELYRINKVLDTATPLAHARRKGAKEVYDVCFWINDFEKGKVFGTTVGHHNETVQHPVWLKTVTRGFLWAVGKMEDKNLNDLSDEAIAKVVAEAKALKGQGGGGKAKATGAKKGNKVPLNLAQGRPTQASSEEKNKNNFSKNGNDGDLSTRWCASGSRPNESWQVDFGAPKHVRGCRIHWEKLDGTAYQYTVEASSDGENWTEVVDQSKNSEKLGIQAHKVDAPNTRFMRVTFLGSSSGSWGSFWEFEAYTGKMPEIKTVLKRNSGGNIKVPEGFRLTMFGEPPTVNYPVCIAAAPTGELFVGVDENGSLGKGRMGKALRCVDTDGDGVADEFKVFAEMIHPRGLFFDNNSLWVLHPPFLTLFRDVNGDGVSDESKVLLTGISTEALVKKRGADHTTNGIRVGADGWIYISVGDFGFLKATDASGKEVQFHGGGIARVRPDGTELEIYARGLRNVCDVAIDPYLNLFTRDNTNDGGGWDIRVSHIVGSAHYGYPSLYKNFADEHVQPLGDFGGGSGTGALYIDEPYMPEAFRKVLLTCDWGRSAFYTHPLTAKGASFETDQEMFMQVNRATDMDVDGSGRLYVSSWKGGGFSYSNPNVGYVAQLTAIDHKPEPFPDLTKATDKELLDHIGSASHVRRLHTQWEMVRRGGGNKTLVNGLISVAKGDGLLASKVMAIFALKQMLGAGATDTLVALSREDDIREFTLRALADRKSQNANVPVAPFVQALGDRPRVQVQALIGLGRLGKLDAAQAIVPLTASSDPVVAHVAVKALVELKASSAALAAVQPSDMDAAKGALEALRQIHEKPAVEGLISKLQTVTETELRKEILTALIRLYYREAEWKGSWWGTRPDTSGPYYGRATWEQSPLIEATLHQTLAGADKDTTEFIHAQIIRHKVKTSTRLVASENTATEEPTVDVAKVLKEQADTASKGIGAMKFEEALAATLKEKGNAKHGKTLFDTHGCVACHAVDPNEAPRGPMLQDITKRYSSKELIDSILRPSQIIAQGFAAHTFELKDGEEASGFVVGEGAEDVEIRTILGESITIVKTEIAKRTVVEKSMMPDGLVSAMTPKDLASLLAYLKTLEAK